MYDFLILNDNPIRIPQMMLVLVKIFYSGTAIISFSDRQNCNENSVSQVSQKILLLVNDLATTQNTFHRIVKPLSKDHKKGSNDLL